jgi:hypothetical protein
MKLYLYTLSLNTISPSIFLSINPFESRMDEPKCLIIAWKQSFPGKYKS